MHRLGQPRRMRFWRLHRSTLARQGQRQQGKKNDRPPKGAVGLVREDAAHATTVTEGEGTVPEWSRGHFMASARTPPRKPASQGEFSCGQRAAGEPRRSWLEACWWSRAWRWQQAELAAEPEPGLEQVPEAGLALQGWSGSSSGLRPACWSRRERRAGCRKVPVLVRRQTRQWRPMRWP